MSEWTIEDQDEMTRSVSDLILVIKNTHKSKDPEILKLLDQFQEEKDAAKNIAILTKIIEKL